jgi:hypothetical protein
MTSNNDVRSGNANSLTPIAKAVRACMQKNPAVQLASAASLTLCLAFVPSVLQAAQYTVTNTNDSGPGSLREAITLANQSDEFDTIVFDSGVTGTISLASGLGIGPPPWYYFPLAAGLAIVGPGSDKLTIQGGGLARKSHQRVEQSTLGLA